MRVSFLASVLLLAASAAALRLPETGIARRQALALGAGLLSAPRSSSAFDLPILEQFDDPKARKKAASMPNPPATKQQSSAFYAVSTGDQDSLQAMIDAGWALGEVSDTAGKTVLHRAAQVGNARAVEALLKAGSTVDPVTQWKETPLHMAVRTNRLPVVKQLVEQGASLSKQTIGGDDALAIAKKYRYAEVETYLAGKQ